MDIDNFLTHSDKYTLNITLMILTVTFLWIPAPNLEEKTTNFEIPHQVHDSSVLLIILLIFYSLLHIIPNINTKTKIDIIDVKNPRKFIQI